MARADIKDGLACAISPYGAGGSRVRATPPVLALLERLQERYGPLVIHQSGGCCDGSAPICLPAAELPPSPSDVLLGTLGETPVYIDGDQDRRWQYPELVIDAGQGAAMGFSLEGVEGVHLVARQPCAR
jgi:uncharacterized protein